MAPNLVGHSYGGVVVALAASRRSDLVRSLVLVDPALHSAADDDPDAAAMLEREAFVAQVAASAVTTREWARTWMMQIVGADAAGADRFLDFWSQEDWEMLEIVRREQPAGAAPVAYEALATASIRAVAVVGGQPPPTGPLDDRNARLGRALVAGLARRPGAGVEVFENSTHFAPSEEPERFNALLRDVWNGT